MLEFTVPLKIVSIFAIVVGVLMEIFLVGSKFSIGVGSDFSLGTGIAAAGIIVFVYDFYQQNQGPKA